MMPNTDAKVEFENWFSEVESKYGMRVNEAAAVDLYERQCAPMDAVIKLMELS